ncbi:hypothetical protein GCM10027047_36060 [Rhodococcus aerolatus]
MAAALTVLAAALLVLPPGPARRRARTLAVGGPAVRRVRRPVGALGAAAAGFTVGVLLGGVLPGAALALAAATAQRRWRARRTARRDAAEVGALVAGLEVVVAELRVGAHPATACATAAEEVDEPVRTVLAEAAARCRLGGSAAEGLTTGPGALAAELERVAAAWRVADERGVALAELLDAVRVDVAGRVAFRSRADAGLAGPRATAAVLAALPLLGIGLGEAVGAAPVGLLLGTPTGGVLLLVGTALACAGLAWTARITAVVAR